MSRSTFIAARNSRHRTAAIALYRALLRTASKVPVPVENAAQKTSKDLKTNPVVRIVRKRFAKNTPYTSFRLIYAAMTAGYKVGFLSFFQLLWEALDVTKTCNLILINSTVSQSSHKSAKPQLPRTQPSHKPSPIRAPNSRRIPCSPSASTKARSHPSSRKSPHQCRKGRRTPEIHIQHTPSSKGLAQGTPKSPLRQRHRRRPAVCTPQETPALRHVQDDRPKDQHF